jgi:hypothetical protein
MRQQTALWASRSRTVIVICSLCIACAEGAFASDHPGNIYVQGEDVRVRVPDTWGGWRAIDVDGKEVGRGGAMDGSVALGKLPIGYYEVMEKGGAGLITAGVVARNTPTEKTPIALDAAMSWFYPEAEQIRGACKIARLAGVNWVRDRASWPELETARGTWAGDTRYERTMRIEHEAGLKVLQVNHISPAWATKNPTRFPEDLRDVFQFYRGLAKRWKGLADAIEPWNEPDIDVFGGHTGCEIASFQKAAYLGLKAGDPQTPVCGTVFAIDRAETLEEFGANDVVAYFDRYNLHHYIRLPEYPRAYGRHRAVSGGRPMWTTEFNLTVHWADEKTKEPSHDELRVQGYRVGKVFARALHEGTEKAFYFILGDYVERELQYGIVHKDLTPRPAYVAFAAVGRLLNGATPIGRVDFGDEKLKGYLFATEVDGQKHETLVAWSETKPTTVEIPAAESMYDYLGRALPPATKVELGRATVFVVLPPGGSKGLKVAPSPAKAARVDASPPCPIVLQLIGAGDVKQSALRTDQSKALRLVAYNFSDKAVRGRLRITGATGGPAEMDIAAGDRAEAIVTSDGSAIVTGRLETGDLGQAFVSSRIVLAAPATAPSR